MNGDIVVVGTLARSVLLWLLMSAVLPVYAWGPGHDTTARCLLARLPADLVSQMNPKWNALYEEASHLPDNGRHELLKGYYRESLESLGWQGMSLHENAFRFKLFDLLVRAIREHDVYHEFMLLAVLSHVNSDPSACNHNPIVHCGCYIWGKEGLGIFPNLDLDFAVVEKTLVGRSVLDRCLNELSDIELPCEIGYLTAYEEMLRLQWEGGELCNRRGEDVMAAALAVYNSEDSAEQHLAESLCELGLFSVKKTLWLYKAAECLAKKNVEPPVDLDVNLLESRIEAEMKGAFLSRRLESIGHFRAYAPMPNKSYPIRVLCDPMAQMNAGVMSCASQLLAPQTVGSLRRILPELPSALLDIRDVVREGVSPVETKVLIVFGKSFNAYLGFDVRSLLSKIVEYARADGKIIWVNGVPPPGIAYGVVAALFEPNPVADAYCNETYPVPMRELFGSVVAWTKGDETSYSYRRRPTGMAGWFWEGSRWAFDAKKLSDDIEPIMELRVCDQVFLTGVVWPKNAPRFIYLPTSAFFPYVLTREKPSATDFKLRLDSAGEDFLLRAIRLFKVWDSGGQARVAE